MFHYMAYLQNNVSIHAPAGGATLHRRRIIAHRHRFNPRARGGRDLSLDTLAAAHQRFNPRARGGRDHADGAVIRNPDSFNHAPAGARLSALYCDACTVSIHAPAGRDHRQSSCRTRFNPRARGGRDRISGSHLTRDKGFNPRARGGRDRKQVLSAEHLNRVSIHAPAGGATILFFTCIIRKSVSIHAPAGGATISLAGHIPFRGFQSTRPRGARRTTRAYGKRTTGFQSTRPRGARHA